MNEKTFFLLFLVGAVGFYFMKTRKSYKEIKKKLPFLIENEEEEINTKEKTIDSLYKVVARMTHILNEIEELEDKFAYEYHIKTEEDFENIIFDERLTKKYPQYDKLKKELKVVIQERILIEKSFFNLHKGIYIGLGVDLLKVASKADTPVYIPWSNWENHGQVLGTTRYGKSYFLALIALQMIMKGWNLVVMDPKGGRKQELLSWMVEFALMTDREEDIVFVNPGYIKKSSLLNAIHGMSNSEIASVGSLLAEGDKDNADPFYSSISYIVTLGICNALEYLEYAFDYDGIRTKAAIEKEILHYHHIINMQGTKLESYDPFTKIASPDAGSRMNAKRGEILPSSLDFLPFHRTLMTFSDLAFYCNHENLKSLYLLVVATPTPSKEYFSDQKRYIRMIKAQTEAIRLLKTIADLGDFYQKISMSIVALYAKLSTGEIGELFCTLRINPLLLRLKDENKSIIAIIQTAPMRFQTTSDMVNKVFIKMFASLFGQVSLSGRGFERRIGFLIDEAKVALFRGIEEIYNKAGGMGMTIVAFMQSEQDAILKVGEVTAKIISDNTNTRICLKVNDNDSKENIVRMFGTWTKHSKTVMGQETLNRQTVMSEEEYLLTTNDIDNLGKGQAFVSSYGKKFLVMFPYILPPAGEIIMPELEEEVIMQDMIIMNELASKAYSVISEEGHDNEKIVVNALRKQLEVEKSNLEKSFSRGGN